VDSTGTLVTIVGFLPQDLSAGEGVTGDDSVNVVVAALRFLMDGDSARPPSGYCLRADSDPLGARIRTTMLASGQTVFTRVDCPTTHSTMVDSPRLRAERPPGWVDPVRFEWHSLTPWTSDLAMVHVTRWQGTGFRRIVCGVTRRQRTWQEASCHTTAIGFS
jgi:hypothetical protein